MKNFNFIPTILILGSFAVSLNACGGGNAIGQPTSITVTPDNPIILVGTTQQFTATGEFPVAPRDDITTEVTWSSSNTAVATVNSNGLSRGLTAGTTIITATFGDVSGGTTLTVTSAPLSSIAVTPANPHLSEGTTQQFRAIGTFSEGTTHDVTSSTQQFRAIDTFSEGTTHDVTSSITWSSSNTAVATVNSHGLATALTPGTTTITATSGNISVNTILTVTQP